MSEVERRVSCPSCSREIRLTEAELLDKRGFCAVCGAHFDIMPEMLIGDGPHRALATVGASLPALPPTDKMTVERVGDEDAVTLLRSRPFPAFQLVFLVFWFGFLSFWCATALGGRGAPSIALLFPLLHVGVGVAVARSVVRDIRGRERLTLGRDALVIERQGALASETRRVEYPDIVATRIEAEPPPSFRTNWPGAPVGKRILLLRSGKAPIPVGAHLGHGDDALGWLAARIEQAKRQARRGPFE